MTSRLTRKQILLLAALALTACAALLFAARGTRERPPAPTAAATRGFVATRGSGFIVDGRPFRFVGANTAVIYGEDERAQMPETLRAAAGGGVRVIRVWAFGEVDAPEAEKGTKSAEWLRVNPFRRGPDGWNEAAFVNLDRVLAEAARNNLRVQICLINWWPDTGGVTQYLRWAGINDAYNPAYPHGVNVERAMGFYTNPLTRNLYREHVERIVLRRNTVTGTLYRDDPTIFSYELMNEAQASAGRWAERRAWVAEMSAFVKSLDPHHLVTPGTWGYRTSWERREWLLDHELPSVDYCDVHVYPRDDEDSYIDSPDALSDFIDNRAAAAFSINKPLVIGEFGMVSEGFKGVSQTEWFRAYFENAARAGVGGAMLWIWTHATGRTYGVTYRTPRDEGVRAELARANQFFAALEEAPPSPPQLLEAGRHLVPRQFAFARDAGDETSRPIVITNNDDTLLYRFAPEGVARGRFERLGSGAGYIWGVGAGFFEYVVPARTEWQWVSEIVVRAHLQPTTPFDANGRITATRVTLFINGINCGARLVPIERAPQAIIQEWRVDSLTVRSEAARGRALVIRFAVEVEADQPFGLTISNFPEGFDPRGAAPIEIEVRR